MILVRNQNHDMISLDLLGTPGGQGKSGLELTERSVDKDHLSRDVGWVCPSTWNQKLGPVLAMLLICHIGVSRPGVRTAIQREPAGLW